MRLSPLVASQVLSISTGKTMLQPYSHGTRGHLQLRLCGQCLDPITAKPF